MAKTVSAASCGKNGFDFLGFKRFFDGFKVEFGSQIGVRFQVDFVEFNAEITQRTFIFGRNHVRKRIVRHSGHRQKFVARAQNAKQHQRQSVRSRNDIRRNDRAFCVKNVGVEPAKRISADIVVAVTGRSEHMASLNRLIFVCVEHLFLIIKCDIVKSCELIFQFGFAFGEQIFCRNFVHKFMPFSVLFSDFIVILQIVHDGF